MKKCLSSFIDYLYSTTSAIKLRLLVYENNVIIAMFESLVSSNAHLLGRRVMVYKKDKNSGQNIYFLKL